MFFYLGTSENIEPTKLLHVKDFLTGGYEFLLTGTVKIFEFSKTVELFASRMFWMSRRS